jgi:methylmalonyl-CoA/ethylmalonyl-CoA epimerase
MVKSVNNVGIAVRNLEQSLAFYQKLGFRVSLQDQNQAFLEAGTARLYLFMAGAGPLAQRSLDLFGNPPGFDHLSFDVVDLESAHRELSQAGLVFESAPTNPGWGYMMASLLDPDGNRIFLLGPIN